jgi:translation elongation factor EF-Ts
MSIELSRAFIFILSAIIMILLLVVTKLTTQFYNENKKFQKKVERLGAIFIECSKYELSKLNQIKLSQELDNKLKTSTACLGENILQMNKYVFEILSKNNLL